ncbi:hypothetical protein Q9Q99_17220 [Curtobacterium flaccumfaciens]|nr:hypothetical protein Q9Q99_17220 [Curtobacterium flaccumfaciens]
MPRQRVRKGWRKWVNTVNVSGVVIVVLTALPLYWLVTTSLKPASEIGQSPPTVWPQSFTFDNFVVAFRDNALGQYMVNSVIVSVSTTVIVLALAFLAGYALAGRFIRGRTAIMTSLLMLSVFPTIAVLTPLYLLGAQPRAAQLVPGSDRAVRRVQPAVRHLDHAELPAGDPCRRSRRRPRSTGPGRGAPC